MLAVARGQKLQKFQRVKVDYKVKYILFLRLPLKFLGFVSVNFQIPDIFQRCSAPTIWSGNFIKVQNNFVCLLPEKKKM